MTRSELPRRPGVRLAALTAALGLAGCLAGLHKKDPQPIPPSRDQRAERDAR